MPQNPANPAKSSQNLSPDKRAAAAAALFAHSVDFHLKKGVVAQVAADVCCFVRTIERLWKCTVAGLKAGCMGGHQVQRKGRCGRKRLYSPDNKSELWEHIERVALSDRMDLRTLAERLGMSRATLHRYFAEKLFRRHSATLKPFLAPKNRLDRLKFALSFVDETAMHFELLLIHVDVDEK